MVWAIHRKKENRLDWLTGQRYGRAEERDVRRWGREDGAIVINGQKVPIRRPRVRSKEGEMKMGSYEGKVAVVTGGNSGIGLATAKRFHEVGARVAIAGRNATTLEEAVKSIGKNVVAVQADVAKLEDIDKLYATVAQKLGRIDVLFVNAGVAKFAPLTDTSERIYGTRSVRRAVYVSWR